MMITHQRNPQPLPENRQYLLMVLWKKPYLLRMISHMHRHLLNVQIFLNKNGETASTTSEVAVSSDLQETLPKTEVQDNKVEDMSSYNSFEEALRSIELRDRGAELPSNLPGVLLDQQYVISPADLNSLIFFTWFKVYVVLIYPKCSICFI